MFEILEVIEMKFEARVYRVNKGGTSRAAYFVTIKKEIVTDLSFKEGDAVLLKSQNDIFPAVIRKLSSSDKKFMLGFTIPYGLGEKISGDNPFEFISKSLSREKSNDEESLSLLWLIPERSINHSPIFLFNHNGKILVWIYSKGNKFTLLPRKIPLSFDKYDLLELAGAFFCDGFKSRKKNQHRDRFSFSNADLPQIKWFVEACEQLLDIKKIEWNVQILYSKEDIERIVYYWSSFGLSKDKIKAIKNPTTNDHYGVCILNIYNSSLAESFYYIAEDCQRRSLLNKKDAICFFRGISRGDLGIGKTREKTISFTTESKENATFFKQLCEVIGITTSMPSFDKRGKKGCWNVSIFRHENFRNLVELGCVTHHQRREELSRKFFTSKKNRYLDYLKAVSKGYNTPRKLISHLNIDESTAGTYLLKFCEQGLLTRKKEVHHYVYELSENGRGEMKFYQDNYQSYL
jgi:predicted transcriptional regulator